MSSQEPEGDAGEGETSGAEGVPDELAGDTDGEEAGRSEEDLGWNLMGEEEGAEGRAARGKVDEEGFAVVVIGGGPVDGSQLPGREGTGSAQG